MAEATEVATPDPVGPRVKAIHIGNFKAFGATQKIPLRPMTIVFGPNSSGKSSIIHSLLFAHEAITSDKANNLDVTRPKLGGESVDLGGFRQFVFRRDASNRIEWGCDLDIARLPDGLNMMLNGAKAVAVSLGIEWYRYMGPRVKEDGVALFIEALKEQSAKAEPGKQIDINRATELILEWERKGTLSPELRDMLIGYEVVRDEDGLALQGPRVVSYQIIVDGATLLKASLKGSGLNWRMMIDVLDTDHSVMRSLFGAMELSQAASESKTDTSMQSAIKAGVDAVVPSLTLERGKFLSTGLTAESFSRLKAFQFEENEQRPARADDIEKIVRLFLPNSLQQLIQGLGTAITSQLQDLHYLGPLRSYPARHLAFHEDGNANWLAGGGFAWDVVKQDAAIRRRVNQWLGADFMKTPYELVPRYLYDPEEMERSFDEVTEEIRRDERLKRFDAWGSEYLGSETQDALSEDASDDPQEYVASGFIEEDDIKAVQEKRWPHTDGYSDFAQLIDATKQTVEPFRDLWLVDKRTSTKVSHRDVGIGVSQVLPVLVTAFASKNSFLAMEQPELHLHPALQAELGDVFIESALRGQNTFLLETHSEHLILRIMRRVRETAQGKLPKGCTPVRPENVLVLYVEPMADGSIVREMPLNENGELVKAWPGGFFEEALREVF